MITLVVGFSVLMLLIALLGGYYANSYLAASAARRQLALFAVMLLIALLGGYYANSYLTASAARRQLALFAENSPHPMMRLDWSGKLIYGNQSAKFLAESMQLPDTADLLPPDLDQRIQALQQANSSGLSWEYELTTYSSATCICCKINASRISIWWTSPSASRPSNGWRTRPTTIRSRPCPTAACSANALSRCCRTLLRAIRWPCC